MTEVRSQRRNFSEPEPIGLISVVITCFNQGHFLSEAIESVLYQTYQSFEIIVIDDGSTDDTPEVACQYANVRYFSQPNQGLSAARNRGIKEGRGVFFVFLDADDRLLPLALEAGERALLEHPECAFAFGDYRDIAYDGTVVFERKRTPVTTGYYHALLKENCIGMHATVIYRRSVFHDIGLFNTSLNACEDYELYLRLSRRLPICHYAVQVAEYRRHDSNMSGDPGLMLKCVLSVLHSQNKYIKDHLTRKAYKAGLRSFAGRYALQLAQHSWGQLRVPNQRLRALKSLLLLCRCYPLGTLRCLARGWARRLPGMSTIRSRLREKPEVAP